jgi:hypothetical protein
MKKFVTFSVLLSILCTGIHAQDTTFPNNVGIGTSAPSSYSHGGTNRFLEILNSATTSHSQSHVILSSGATSNLGSVGTITWATPNSADRKVLAYIGAHITSDATINPTGDLVFATANGGSALERARLSSTGYWGIGTTTPIRHLTVAAASSPEFVLQDNSRLTDKKNYRIYNAGGHTVFGTLNDAGTTGINNMTIDQQSGSVSIGPRYPSSYYHGGTNRVFRGVQ